MSTTSNLATAQLCRATPTVSVIDNRGLAVRTLLFNRNVAGEAADDWERCRSERGRMLELSATRLLN
jgi:hypothetical protein